MADVVGVCFKPTGKVYYFSAKDLELKPGDRVVAETTKGQELAEVVRLGAQCGGHGTKGKLKPILRVATEDDTEHGRGNAQRADEARRVCQRLLAQLQLGVKLVDVEYAFDSRRITFSFASEEKTDFRELRRRLKEIYDCQVELRQIGVRDQAKILGGLGPCGRQLCCASFLRGFQPVTIKMAKDQDLSLNPTKISGQCGRLMCCLRYEHESYVEAKAAMPKVGATVETPEGSGRVTSLDLLNRRMTVDTATGPVQIGLDEVGSSRPTRRKQERTEPIEGTHETLGSEGAEPKIETRERRSDRRPQRPSRRRPQRATVKEPEAAQVELEQVDAAPAAEQAEEKPKRRRPRRRPRRRGGSKATAGSPDAQADAGADAGAESKPQPETKAEGAEAKPAQGEAGPEDKPKTTRRRRRRPRRRRTGTSSSDGEAKTEGGGSETPPNPE